MKVRDYALIDRNIESIYCENQKCQESLEKHIEINSKHIVVILCLADSTDWFRHCSPSKRAGDNTNLPEQLRVVKVVAEPGAVAQQVDGVDNLLLGRPVHPLPVVLPNLRQVGVKALVVQKVDGVAVHVLVEVADVAKVDVRLVELDLLVVRVELVPLLVVVVIVIIVSES